MVCTIGKMEGCLFLSLFLNNIKKSENILGRGQFCNFPPQSILVIGTDSDQVQMDHSWKTMNYD